MSPLNSIPVYPHPLWITYPQPFIHVDSGRQAVDKQWIDSGYPGDNFNFLLKIFSEIMSMWTTYPLPTHRLSTAFCLLRRCVDKVYNRGLNGSRRGSRARVIGSKKERAIRVIHLSTGPTTTIIYFLLL
jgi:hypothetical protein